MNELIVAAIAGYVKVNDPELQRSLVEASYVKFTPFKDFWGIWNIQVLKGMLEEQDDDVIQIRGHWFTRSMPRVEEVTRLVQEIDKEEKDSFHSRLVGPTL
jgi:DNA primase large subunit